MDGATFYRLFSCFFLYLTFIFSLYMNIKGVSKRNPLNKLRELLQPTKKVIIISDNYFYGFSVYIY